MADQTEHVRVEHAERAEQTGRAGQAEQAGRAERVEQAGRAEQMGSARDRTEAARDDRAAHVERRLAGPVILAALASVPAMFLTLLDGPAQVAGQALNYLSLAVLTAESVVLFALAGNRWRWLRQHWPMVAVVVVAVPAVVFALGPAQLLRLLHVTRIVHLLRLVGALRIIRVRRMFKAARILRERAGLTDWRWRVVVGGVTVLAAVFVALVMADPTSTSRQLLDGTVERFGVVAVVLAGLLLGLATFVIARARRRDDEEERSAASTTRASVAPGAVERSDDP